MERTEALLLLQSLVGNNLHELAKIHGVTVVSTNGKVNKGWAGHVCERHLNLPINSAQSPNFGSWELKSIPLKRLSGGSLGFKETMAITMIDPVNVVKTPFSESHLLSKLKKAVLVARVVGDNYSEPTFIHSVTTIDLDGDVYDVVEQDYELVRECIRRDGFSALTGSMGHYVQPRTKGAGHGSTSRAFYARPRFLAEYIRL